MKALRFARVDASSRREFFSDGRKEKERERKNSSRASNKTRENDQSFAVWAGGVGACDEERKRGKNKGEGEIGRTEDTERSWGTRFELNE